MLDFWARLRGYARGQVIFVSSCLSDKRQFLNFSASPMKFRYKLQQQLQIWWPAVAVFAVGSTLSLGLWHALEQRQVQTVQERLEQQAKLFAIALEQRLFVYSDYVQGLRPLLEATPAAADKVFKSLGLMQERGTRYAGMEALTLVRRMDAQKYAAYRAKLLNEVPSALRVDESAMPAVPLKQSSYYIVDEVWPFVARQVLKGLDAQQQPQLQAQIEQFQVNTQAQALMSEPHALDGIGGAGVLIGVPLRGGEAEHHLLDGVLSISVRVDSLIELLRSRGMLPHTLLSIQDQSSDPASRSLTVYESQGWSAEPQSLAYAQRQMSFMGRQWTLDFMASHSMLSQIERSFPATIGASTLAATMLLAAVVLLLSLQRQRAQTRSKAKHNLLRERTDRLKALFNQSAIGVAEIEAKNSRYISANTRFSDIVGFNWEALESMDIYDVIHPDDRQDCLLLERQLSEGRSQHFTTTTRMVRKDGSTIWVELWVSPLQNADGKPLGRHIALLLDVTEHRLMQVQLQAREAYSSEMLRYMPVGLVVVGPVGDIEFVNHQFEAMTGWALSDLSDESSMWRHLCVDMQQHTALLQRLNAGRCEVVPNGVNMPAMEYLLRRKDGQELSMEVSGRFLGGRILLSFVDVSQRKAAEAEIRWLGYYDMLTQLPNRRLLLDRLSEALVRSQLGNGNKGALLLLDIDNFKSLNETLGHDHGDALLRLVATRLSSCIAGRHTLARQGGDEFAVVLEDLPVDPLEAGRCTEQVGCAILQALRTPFYLSGQDFHVTVSMGAVVLGSASDTVEELLKRADLALYQAKSAGRDTLQFFDPSMQKAVSARVEMEKDLRLALERHEFDLFFQPQVQSDKVVGAEALLRWHHPVKGFITPSVFVPAAEDSGLILPLGEWVLYAACRQLAHWAQDPLLSTLTMSVNVSPRQFYQPGFVEQVRQALEVTGAKASLLELELTEGMLLTDVEDTIRKMVQLKTMGVIFSLDDFGTGYSSLSYLKRLPLDKLKIDQSFVREVDTSLNDAAIACSIIALGTSLGLQVIAEGVETEEQRCFLAANGCSYWQGFLFSRPQPVDKFEVWVREYGGSRTVKTQADVVSDLHGASAVANQSA